LTPTILGWLRYLSHDGYLTKLQKVNFTLERASCNIVACLERIVVFYKYSRHRGV